MSTIDRAALEMEARQYIETVRGLHGGGGDVPAADVERAIRETVRASQRFVEATARHRPPAQQC